MNFWDFADEHPFLIFVVVFTIGIFLESIVSILAKASVTRKGK